MRRRSLFMGVPAALAANLVWSKHGRTSTSALIPPTPLSAPSPLRRGSRIRAVNTGAWIDPSTDFSLLFERCAAQGWQLELPRSLHRRWQWFSGTDAERLAELEAAWSDPRVDGIFYTGFGWGSARVLEEGFRFPQRSLWSLGFSDSSSLLLAQWSVGSRGAIHASLAGSDQQWQRTVDLLRGRPVAPLSGKGMGGGVADGPLVITNLTVATHLIGTPWFPVLKGALLILEEVGEAPYRVDRMLTQWRSAGLLRELAGVATGRFSWKEEPEPGDFSMVDILKERLAGLNVPFVIDLPIGHGSPNLALPLGVKARLDGQSGSLMLLP
ncbi:MAG: LD-carboxypeptidase [Prochlorococcus sp.]|tara:strand:+ start:1574 stop:2551 length:978 start_codon:yes stop_codon:yes gene_type:complete